MQTRATWLAIALAIAVTAAGEARAQNIFDLLFGGFKQQQQPPQQPGAPPPEGTIPPEQGYGGGGQAYCVRLCDGRYFPLQPHPTASPAQLCSAFCPASQTRIFRGSPIENAVGPDGGRYPELKNAFVYRKQLVPGCTCNGKDAFGLVTLDAANDPTLRPGDAVATPDGKTATVKAMPPGGVPPGGVEVGATPPGNVPPGNVPSGNTRPPAQQRQY
jgi:hypothetical protein